MKILVYLLLPLVSLASEADGLIDLARGAPAEFAADALIRIAALEQTPKTKKIELLRQAFDIAGGAQHPYKLQSAVTRMGGAAGFLNRAYLQDMDALTLRLRAIDALLPLDPARARELFQQLPPVQLPSMGCSLNQAYDVSLLYSVLGSVGAGAGKLVDQYMATVSSPSQVGPAARMLAHAGLSNDDFRSAVTAFAGALGKVGPDDRSFTLAAGAGADILALVEACRTRGVPPILVIDAYRQYLVSHLAGERCADNAQMRSNSANIGTGIANQPIADVGSAAAVEFFNEKLRVPPVRAIERYETYASKTEGGADAPAACDDAPCKAVQERYRHLIFNSVGVAYSQEERGKTEWRDQLPGLLDALAQWKETGDTVRDRIAFYAAKCGFYSDLAAMVVTTADREAVYGALLDFLMRSSLRTESRMEWFLPVNGLIGRSATDASGFGRLLGDLGNSSDAVIALYAQLEKVAPRPPGSIVPLL